MRRYRVLKTVAKIKLATVKFFSMFKDKKNPAKERREKESSIMTLLTDGLSTEDSIKLYKSVERRYKSELERREKRAVSEISAINIFSSDDNSFENAKPAGIIFERASVEQSI